MQFGNNDLVSLKNRALALVGSPSLNLNDQTAQVNVNTAAGDGAVGVQLPNRLDLLAGNNIINKSGGVIAGRDVTLTAVSGDVINERSVTTTDFSNKGYTQQRDYLDSAARIEAANDLSISAGRDVLNTGSVLSLGRDTEIQAGRDINVASTEQQSSDTGGTQKSSVTQFGSSLNAGCDIALSAGRDINIVASELEAKRNIGLSAEGDVTIASGADESHSNYKSKKVTAQEDHVKQVASAITAGGDVAMIKAVDGLKIDIKEVDQQTVSQTIDAMVKADPQLVWLKKPRREVMLIGGW